MPFLKHNPHPHLPDLNRLHSVFWNESTPPHAVIKLSPPRTHILPPFFCLFLEEIIWRPISRRCVALQIAFCLEPAVGVNLPDLPHLWTWTCDWTARWSVPARIPEVTPAARRGTPCAEQAVPARLRAGLGHCGTLLPYSVSNLQSSLSWLTRISFRQKRKGSAPSSLQAQQGHCSGQGTVPMTSSEGLVAGEAAGGKT